MQIPGEITFGHIYSTDTEYAVSYVARTSSKLLRLHDCTVENAMTPTQQYVYINDDLQQA